MNDQSPSLSLGPLQQKSARPVDPEQLESLGKQAAALFRDNQTPLSQAVVETVKEARLSPEQVKRVCEFANTTAYLEAFDKMGSVRNVVFDGGPADPARVIQDLNSGAHPAVHHVASDYAKPFESYKKASVRPDDIFAESFQITPTVLEKTASLQFNHSEHASPVEDVNDMRIRLEAVREDLMSKISSSGVIREDMSSDLCRSAAQAVSEGYSLGDIAKAWSGYSSDAGVVKEAMSLVAGYLNGRGYSEETLNMSMRKTASAGNIPNPQHPLVEQFVAFSKVAHGHRVLETAVSVVDEQLREVRTALGGMVS